MRVLFYGTGSIAQRHIRLIRKVFPQHELYSTKHSRKLENVEQIESLTDKRFDVAFICTPTHKHIIHAIACAEAGMSLFIEKPLDCSYHDLDTLLKIVKEKNLTAYIAYPFRHHPTIQRTRNQISARKCFGNSLYLECQTNIKNWGKEYSKDAKTGGGAILELSHELDTAVFINGPVEVIDICCCASNTKFEEYAFCRIRHVNNSRSEIVLNLGAAYDVRNLEIRHKNIGKDQDYSINECYNYDISDAVYTSQLKYFFDNLRNHYLMNNIYEHSDFFKRLIDARDKSYADSMLFSN